MRHPDPVATRRRLSAPPAGRRLAAQTPRRLAALVVGLALAAAACSATGNQAGPATTTTAASDATTTTGAPTTSDASTIDWSDCGGGFECGRLAVPLDHDDPEGETIELDVTRHRADDPDRRIGALLLNPGGPGGSATELARTYPRAGELGDRFDIVGFDPRGVGTSEPVLDCSDGLQAMYDADPTIDSPADEEEYLATSEAYVDDCAAAAGDALAFMGTTEVAKDMDLVREALGEDQISYLGYSYGTSIGQEYARLFPERVRAMILDGVVDHAPDGVTTATDQAEGFELALDNYVAHCAESGCGLPGDARAVIDDVVAAAEDAPIPAPDADRPATPGVVNLALAQSLYAEQLWSVLSAALRDAVDGDGTGLVELADQYLGREPDGSYPSSFAVYFAVSCLDEEWPATTDEFFADAAAAGETSPTFGEAIVNDYLRCALWPVDAEPLAPVPADTEGLPPILVVSTTGDPATPYENGVAVADQIPGAVLVTNEGEGHTIVGLGKPCIDDLALAYLVDLTVPDDGTTCPR